MIIRKAKKEDISAIIAIGEKVKEFRVASKIKNFWSRKQLLRWLTSRSDVFLVAEERDKIIGFAMFAHHVPTGKVTFEDFWIHKNHRGEKVGSRLFNEGIKQLKKKGAIYLCSLIKEDSKSALTFHKKFKFKKGYKFWWLHRKI